MALARSARALAPPPGAWHDAYLAPAYAVFGRALAAGSGLLGREDVQAGGHAPQPPHTIFALSTGPGRAAVAVVRLSGPGAGGALCRRCPGGAGLITTPQRLQRTLRPPASAHPPVLWPAPPADAALAALLPRQWALPPPRTLALATLRHPETREVLDKAMVVRFPAPGSFTGAGGQLGQGQGSCGAVVAGLPAQWNRRQGCPARLRSQVEYTRWAHPSSLQPKSMRLVVARRRRGRRGAARARRARCGALRAGRAAGAALGPAGGGGGVQPAGI